MTRDLWEAWLDRMREELRSAEQQLAQGHDLQWSVHHPPPGPVPLRKRAQVEELSRQLERIVQLTLTRQEELRARLTSLPRSRPRGRGESLASLGGNLDVLG